MLPYKLIKLTLYSLILKGKQCHKHSQRRTAKMRRTKVNPNENLKFKEKKSHLKKKLHLN